MQQKVAVGSTGHRECFERLDPKKEFIMKRTFAVKAVWDEEAQVFYAQSDIEGLHIEAASLDEFEEIMLDAVPELIMANHRIGADIS